MKIGFKTFLFCSFLKKVARKAIDKNHGKGIIVVRAKNDDFNRKILENKKVNILLSPESGTGIKHDKLKQRDSGLNHVLCKIAKQNNIAIAIDFSEILKKQNEEKQEKGKKQLAEHLARIMQNIKLCKKSGTKIILMKKQGKNNYDLQAFLLTLGMPTNMAKIAVEKID